jgi:hypothetical protein
VKSSNEDKHWQTASRSRARPPFPNPAGPTVAPWEEALKADGTPNRRAWRGQAIEFLLKASARCCSVTSQLSPVSN